MLARSFLRLTALEALRPSSLLSAGSPAWPTLAGQYVSDSRIDPIDDLAPDERRPLIGVYTEDGDLTKIAQAGPQFYKGEVDLIFEISVVQKFAQDGGDPIIDFADTDAATEAQLDGLEDQIYWCLHFGPSGALFRKMSRLPFLEWKSTPHRSGEEAIKLARRTIKARIRVVDACYDPAPAVSPVDLARLPKPLGDIAAALGDSTYLATLVLGLARVASVMPLRVDLDRVTMDVQNQDLSVSMVDVTAEIESRFAVRQTIASGGPVTIDYERGTFQMLTLAADIGAMNVVNWPAPGKTGRLVLQITNAGNLAINAWPAGTVWSAGNPPTITLGANKRDVVVLTTQDAGATIFGALVGQDYH